MLLSDGSTAKIVVDPSGLQTVVLHAAREDGPPLGTSGYTSPFPVYIPHTVRHPQTALGAPENATWVDVSQSPNAYYAALAHWWERGETFMVLEHDVICRPDVIEEFDACPEPWCLYGYTEICHRECMEAWRNALGCTRFRKELIDAVPDALASVPRENWDWHNVCDGLGNNLRAAGFTHHFHEPWVSHHRKVQAP